MNTPAPDVHEDESLRPLLARIWRDYLAHHKAALFTSMLCAAIAGGLSALTLGEEAASGIGLDLRRQRIFTVVGAGLATGGAVALAGAIGFVGIVAPHLIRPFVGHDPARSLVPSALLSGLILVVADIFIRLLPTSAELKLGVVAALIGAPAFVWIAMQRRGGND